MIDTNPEKPSKWNSEVLMGLLFGILASLGCLFLALFFGSTVGGEPETRRQWVFPVFDAIALILAGIVPLKRVRQPGYYPSYALGLVIALSLALLLDGACAVAFFR